MKELKRKLFIMTKVIAVLTATEMDLESVDKKQIFNRIGELRNQLISLADIDDVILASPDMELISLAEANDWQQVLTYRSHPSTTGHCAQAAKKYWTSDIILDVPAFNIVNEPACLQPLIAKMLDDSWMQIACVRQKIVNAAEFSDPEVVKVVTDRYNRVLYLSRAAIPFVRSLNSGSKEWYAYVPLHAFRNKSLQEIADLQTSPLEQSEQIEALRWLENNYSMYAFGE